MTPAHGDRVWILSAEEHAAMTRRVTTAELELSKAHEVLRQTQAVGSKAVGAVVERYFKEWRRLYEDPK